MKFGHLRKTSLLIVLVLAAARFFLGPGPGPVLAGHDGTAAERIALGPLILSLKDGRHVVVSMDLQLSRVPAPAERRPADGTDRVDSTRALDLTIAELCQRTSHELDTASERAAAKADITSAIVQSYGSRVLDVGFDEFLVH